jgi:type IV pilus assembly protein PilZ
VSEDNSKNSTPPSGVLSLTIKEKAALYAAYMPFLKNGGLFIPTKKSYKLGEEVFMLLTLLEDPTRLTVAGHVAWIMPIAQGNRPQGIGVQFTEENGGTEARHRIESMLVGMLRSERPTYTL